MKRLGIPGWMIGENSFGVPINYLEFIAGFGKPVIITPMDSQDLPKIDLLVCPGGLDISPTSYGATPHFKTQKPNPVLEHFDAAILPQYIENKTPVFGICRGFHRLWAMYGGQIEQHNTWHDQSTKHPTEQIHELEFTEDFKEYKNKIAKVTSRHHQCADASNFVPGELEVIAYSKEGGKYYPSVVEIFKHKTLQIFGVQFHPEDHDGTDELSSMIIREYLNI